MAVPPPDLRARRGISVHSAAGAEKAALRAEIRARRDAFAATAYRTIAPPLALIDRLRPGMTVAGYIAMGSEADPALLLAAAGERGCAVALPHVTRRTAPMRFLRWAPGDPLESGPMGLLQPRTDAGDCTPDLFLTPLIAFDAAGRRLGQGAGFYDRAFAAAPGAFRIGVAWSMQQVDHLPTDAWDIPLHAIITEQGWITPQ